MGSENQTVVGMMGVHDNDNHDLQEISFSLYFNVGVLVLTLLLFSTLRTCYPIVYSQKAVGAADDAMDPNGDAPGGFCGWIRLLYELTDEDAWREAGLDGLMLITYFRLSRRIIGLVALACLLVLCPTHYFYGVQSQKANIDIVSRISIEALLTRPSFATQVPYWIHAIMVWVVVLTAISLIYKEHVRYLDLRFKWLCQLKRPQATTLLIENIPGELCSDAALHQYFVKLFGQDAIERAYLVRRTGYLRNLIADRSAAEDALKRAEVAWDEQSRDPEKRPMTNVQQYLWCCGAEGEDAMALHAHQVRTFQARVDSERRSVEEAVPLKDTAIGGVCSKAGFVTFTSLRSCRLASREQFKPDATVMVPYAPPPPDDVDWEAIGKDPIVRESSRWLFGVYLMAIFFAWLPMVASVGALVNFHEIEERVPFVAELCENRPSLALLIQAVVSAGLLKLLMSMMPFALMWGIRRFLSPRSGNEAQVRLQAVYYAFLVMFVLLITAITSTLWNTVKTLADSPRMVFPMLATSLPGKSHWYTEFIILGWVADTAELIRISNLSAFLGWRLLLGQEEAKRRSEPQDQDFYGMGARMSRCALHLTVALVFCTCFPPIACIAWVMLLISTHTHTYLIVFAENKMPDYGGEFWVEGLKHILCGLVLFVLLMVGVLHEHSSWRQSLFALTSLMAIAVCWRSLGLLVWQSLPFETVAEVDDHDRNCLPKAFEYVQRECLPDRFAAAAPSASLRQPGAMSSVSAG
eukprot:TRINITY_DN51487_c0_g1_i1.p1 TRINITY_DN51487_c0_g1~~TRINITY_DN51487_c0_g1_i1.p1  ORF type:complete len:750 (+),score=186.77 TRINITY_DN51487_c0_g1_i1:338-2587(+)